MNELNNVMTDAATKAVEQKVLTFDATVTKTFQERLIDGIETGCGCALVLGGLWGLGRGVKWIIGKIHEHNDQPKVNGTQVENVQYTVHDDKKTQNK